MATFTAGCTLLFGGSGGIGQGVARTFAEQGSDIAVVYRSKRAAADAVAAVFTTALIAASAHPAGAEGCFHMKPFRHAPDGGRPRAGLTQWV